MADNSLFGAVPDPEVEDVREALVELDPGGLRTAAVLRATIDQLYDGQRTGRYRWDQLHKTEKTHCGTLVEINMQREFDFEDGTDLDYLIAGVDVDCKYSQRFGGWMIPPEAHNKICMLLWADDEKSVWSLGVGRMRSEILNLGSNRDHKATIKAEHRSEIAWLFRDAELPPNVLLHLPRSTVDRIMSFKHGTQRINELFRSTLGMRVGRGVVATVAQQADYMKRVRSNGGARTALQPEGIIILGQYSSHAAIAAQLGVDSPQSGESVAVRVSQQALAALDTAQIDGKFWRLSLDSDPVATAPRLPSAGS